MFAQGSTHYRGSCPGVVGTVWEELNHQDIETELGPAKCEINKIISCLSLPDGICYR